MRSLVKSHGIHKALLGVFYCQAARVIQFLFFIWDNGYTKQIDNINLVLLGYFFMCNYNFVNSKGIL